MYKILYGKVKCGLEASSMDFLVELLNCNHDDRPRVNPLHIIINWLNETVDLGLFS